MALPGKKCHVAPDPAWQATLTYWEKLEPCDTREKGNNGPRVTPQAAPARRLFHMKDKNDHKTCVLCRMRPFC